MSWRFPEHTPVPSRVTDFEDMNRGILPVAEELGGRLNEPHWASGAISDRTVIANDAAFVWHQDGRYVSYPGATANQITVSPVGEWIVVADASVAILCPSCLLWIHAGCAFYRGDGGTPAANPGPPIALRVDGNVGSETITGSVEHENDDYGALFWGSVPSIAEAIIPVGEGNHTIELVVRTLRNGLPANVYPIFINSREIIVLEMRR